MLTTPGLRIVVQERIDSPPPLPNKHGPIAGNVRYFLLLLRATGSPPYTAVVYALLNAARSRPSLHYHGIVPPYAGAVVVRLVSDDFFGCVSPAPTLRRLYAHVHERVRSHSTSGGCDRGPSGPGSTVFVMSFSRMRSVPLLRVKHRTRDSGRLQPRNVPAAKLSSSLTRCGTDFRKTRKRLVRKRIVNNSSIRCKYREIFHSCTKSVWIV